MPTSSKSGDVLEHRILDQNLDSEINETIK